MRLHELIEKRANAVQAMRALADLAERESRDLNTDEEKRYGDLKVEIAGLDKKVERARELEAFERAAPAIVTRRGDGRYEDRAREFSICRAIAGQLQGSGVDDGLEREISAEVVKRTGRKPQGFFAPDEIFLRPERRTLLAGSSAADLIPTVHRADLFIDRLRAALVTERLGATVLDGLAGNVEIPKASGSSTAAWVGEDGSLSETDATFSDVDLTPKTVGCMTSFSRRTLINAVPSVEDLVRRDLAAVIANEIDIQAMTGDGSSNTPTGITNSGASEIDLSSADHMWEQILEFIATVQHANAMGSNLGWALNSWAVKRLRAAPRFDVTAGNPTCGGYVMESPTEMAGYPAGVTSALPGVAGASPEDKALVIFGEWSSLIIGYWSGTDILVNPYESTAYAKGRVLVRAMRDVNVAVRHVEAFAFSDNLDTDIPQE
jgi:HK97 family phage major capsid protein